MSFRLQIKHKKGKLADSHSVLYRWENHYYNLLNVHGVNAVRQSETRRAETLATETIVSEPEVALAKWKRSHQVLIIFQQN